MVSVINEKVSYFLQQFSGSAGERRNSFISSLTSSKENRLS